MRAVELFAGAGGLALGASLAGFKPLAVVEWDRWACDTIRENRKAEHPLVADWPEPHEGDVREFNWHSIPTDIELVAGGPPCQPFSTGGKARANKDSRDMFPATVEVVRRLRPKAFVVENVKGLTRSAFHNYFNYIQLQLEFPERPRRMNEEWLDHYARLQELHSQGPEHQVGLTYRLQPHLLNAADYGIPQRRERVFIVGFRSDLETTWSMPSPTHSYEGLLFDQWVTGEYWDRVKMAKKARPQMPIKLAKTVARLRASSERPLRAWRTVREALLDLPNPERKIPPARDFHLNHSHQPGARPYPGHTGSPLDLPAKTLKAGDHGVPGGENMMVNDDGSCRYFTVRESARLQTFPDGYKLHGAWGEAMRQLGNAVPVELARQVFASVSTQLVEAEFRKMTLKNLAEVRRALTTQGTSVQVGLAA